MKYRPSARLSMPEARELKALAASLTLDAASTFENLALSKSLANEGAAIWHVGPTVEALARSPVWRLMCAELVAAAGDPAGLQLAFLLASARLYQAGAAAERDSE